MQESGKTPFFAGFSGFSPSEDGGEDGIRSPFLMAETLMFIGIWRFVGQTIGQLNDQISLILQNVQRQGTFTAINPGGSEHDLNHQQPLGHSQPCCA